MQGNPRGLYSAAEVGQLAGVSRYRIGQWTRHGYIRSSRSTGPPRVYSFQDAAEAIVVHELITRGVTYRDIRRTIDNTRDEYGDWPLTAAPLATTVDAAGHGPARVLLQLRDVDLDIGRDHRSQAVLSYPTLQAVTELLRRGGWAIRDHPDIQRIEVHPERFHGVPTIRGTRIPARQVAVIAAEGSSGLRDLREGYDLHRADVEDAVRWYGAVTAYDRAA